GDRLPALGGSRLSASATCQGQRLARSRRPAAASIRGQGGPAGQGSAPSWRLVGCQKPIRTQRRSSKTAYDQPPLMLLFVLYACLRLLLDLAFAPLRDHAADQAELLVLRHQVRVLERQVKVVRWRQADRLVLAALARRLPRPAWSTLLVKPETVLRWHREPVRRKWASFAGRPRRGRPSISEECRGLIRQLAKENSGWGYLRLKGELRKRGFAVSASTIRRVLRRHRIPPAPQSLGAHLAQVPCSPRLHDRRHRLLLSRHRLHEAAVRPLLHPPGEPPHPLRRLHRESGL